MEFITIPFAANYEINKKGVVRKKSTKLVLKSYLRRNERVYIIRCNDGVRRNFHIESLYKICLDNLKWQPVPSLNNLYEVNHLGELRNAVSKRVIKKRRSGSVYFLTINKKNKYVTVAGLLWEVFGVVSAPAQGTPIGVTVVKDRFCKTFPTISAAAIFLAVKIFLSADTLRAYMRKRRPEIDGWKISYKEPDNFSNMDRFGTFIP